MINYATGNLLDAQTEALVNTVNEVGVMGKGIALMFREAFPANTAAYEAACKATASAASISSPASSTSTPSPRPARLARSRTPRSRTTSITSMACAAPS